MPCTYSRKDLPGGTQPVSSDQAPLRHIRGFTYRCFLPDLTGFVKSYCARPNRQHHLVEPDPTRSILKQEFDPAIAACGYRAPLPPRLARHQHYIGCELQCQGKPVGQDIRPQVDPGKLCIESTIESVLLIQKRRRKSLQLAAMSKRSLKRPLLESIIKQLSSISGTAVLHL